MKRPYKPRCGASLPDQDAEENQHYCYHPAGHTGQHEDDERVWSDADVVEVVRIEKIRAVPHHEHDFVGDADTCVRVEECPLTWGDHKRQQSGWEDEQADICSYCGHAAHCHTTSLPEEGRRDYCTECDGAHEFHAMDEEPKPVIPTREQMLAKVRELIGPVMPQERIEQAVDRLQLSLGLEGQQAAPSPQEAAVDALHAWVGKDIAREEIVGVVARLKARTGVVRQDEDDLAVECECGTVWPDGVMGKGHNDMDCEQADPALDVPEAPQNSMDDDICFCGCAYKDHRSSPNWGESCDGCTAQGARATYQWRHPFTRDVGGIRR